MYVKRMRLKAKITFQYSLNIVFFRFGCSLDDEPECGPDVYIVLEGFMSPGLITELGRCGVHISALVELQVPRSPEDLSTRASEASLRADADQEISAPDSG